MLFITVTGVFLPLEVALNSVWGVKKNRNYLHNQVVSIGLALGVALLAMASVALSAAQQTVLGALFFGHTDNIVFNFIAKFFLQICALVASVGLFFLIYWGLPNRKVPPRAVLPTAIVMGVLWTLAKYLYMLVLPHLDFYSVYGPFYVSVSLMMWAFISGLLLLAGAYVSATREALRETRALEGAGRRVILASVERLDDDVVWMRSGRQKREERRPRGAIGSDHSNIGGSGVGHQQQMLICGERQCVRVRAGAHAGLNATVIDAVETGGVRAEVRDPEA